MEKLVVKGGPRCQCGAAKMAASGAARRPKTSLRTLKPLVEETKPPVN